MLNEHFEKIRIKVNLISLTNNMRNRYSLLKFNLLHTKFTYKCRVHKYHLTLFSSIIGYISKKNNKLVFAIKDHFFIYEKSIKSHFGGSYKGVNTSPFLDTRYCIKH